MKELSAYLDSEIDETLKQELQEHLGRCHECKVIFDTTRKTIELYCDGKLFPLPATVRDRLHQALRRKVEEKGRSCH